MAPIRSLTGKRANKLSKEGKIKDNKLASFTSLLDFHDIGNGQEGIVKGGKAHSLCKIQVKNGKVYSYYKYEVIEIDLYGNTIGSTIENVCNIGNTGADVFQINDVTNLFWDSKDNYYIDRAFSRTIENESGIALDIEQNADSQVIHTRQNGNAIGILEDYNGNTDAHKISILSAIGGYAGLHVYNEAAQSSGAALIKTSQGASGAETFMNEIYISNNGYGHGFVLAAGQHSALHKPSWYFHSSNILYGGADKLTEGYIQFNSGFLRIALSAAIKNIARQKDPITVDFARTGHINVTV